MEENQTEQNDQLKQTSEFIKRYSEAERTQDKPLTIAIDPDVKHELVRLVIGDKIVSLKLEQARDFARVLNQAVNDIKKHKANRKHDRKK